MSSSNESFYSMLLRVIAVLTNFNGVLSSINTFTPEFNALQSYATKIGALEELIGYDSSGNSKMKQTIREKLHLLAMDTVRRIIAYAQTNNQLVLKNEININSTEMNRLADTKFKITCQGVYDKAQVNLGVLASFGVNTTTQALLLAEINNYNNYMVKPQIAQGDMKSLRQQQADLYALAKKSLKNISAIVDIFQTSNKILYSHFISAKKMARHSNKSFDVICLVVNDADSTGLEKVPILIYREEDYLSDDPSVKPVIDRKTAAKGGLYIKTIAAGTYIVVAKMFGYKDVVMKIFVNSGKKTKFYIRMVKLDRPTT